MRLKLSGLLSVLLVSACASAPTLSPPVAAKKPYTVESPHGGRSDPYYWLRDDSRKNPEMLAHLAAENAYKSQQLAPFKRLENHLFEEIKARIQEDDASVPVRWKDYWYYSRFESGREYPIHARRKGSMTATEEVLLDLNVLSKGQDYYQISGYEISPDQRWMAFAEDTVGRRQYTLRVKDLQEGRTLDLRIPNIQGDIVWLNDNKTLLYTEKDPVTLLGYRVRSHTLGSDPAQDPVVYEEKDRSFYLGVQKSKSGQYVFIGAQSTLVSEWHYADANELPLKLRVVKGRTPKHEYQVEHLDDDFIIRTNWKAPNFRIVRVPIRTSRDRRTWKDVIAHRDDAFIQGYDVFREHVAVSERSGGLLKMRIASWDLQQNALISMDEPAYTTRLSVTPELDSATVRYVYTSMTTPPSTYDYDLRSGERSLQKREAVLGDFDPAQYVTEYVHATAADGTRVPVSLVYRKGLRRDGTASLYQYAYGAYGYSMDPGFSSARLSLLDRGFVYAIAHVRGGQEMGYAWYEQGRLLNKKNTFTDFIAVTDYLIAQGYAAPDKVFAMGGSAGGLLMGAINNMAPEKYRGIVAHVPFVDVVTTMLDESIPLTTNEFDEWGNPKQKRYYEYMLSYSPYDQVAPRDYPALLVTTGLWDSQVQYFEPAKWVARLREADTSPQTPVLFHINMEAGHGGKSGRFQRLRETAQEYAFILGRLAPKP